MKKIELYNKEVSVESYLDTFLVKTWYKPRKKAAASGIRDFGSNIDKPGLIIIKTPIKPIEIATHVLKVTSSFRKNNDKITTITGVSDPMLWASARERYLNDKTKKPDSKTDKIPLKICNLIFLE